jgi:23S rRNA U2552 (ribose-2'-O)-methylase RlmE/FtsJ
MPNETGYWTKDEAATQHDFSEALAEWISWYFLEDKTIIDFGCGNGKYVAYLESKGFDIAGIEGDGSTVTERIKFIEQDLTKPFGIECGNAICLEVGEHIPAEYTKQFIDNLTNNTKDTIILSWALPGQEGYYHVNCKSNEWVQIEMENRGFKYMEEDTQLARNIVEDRFNYFKNTIMIFQKEGVLDKIGRACRTDKSAEHHDYCKIYEAYLNPLKSSNVSLIEIGVGGYEFPDRGGESLRMWYQYFPNGKIIGIDIFPKEGVINDRTEFWQGSQTDDNLLRAIITREYDKEKRIVIDDASHHNLRTIETFKIVFPLLKSGDMYFIEDVHTSYWLDYYDGNEVPGADATTMRFFTDLTHQLNHDTMLAKYKNKYAGKIEFIHFYKEIIVIKKL